MISLNYMFLFTILSSSFFPNVAMNCSYECECRKMVASFEGDAVLNDSVHL